MPVSRALSLKKYYGLEGPLSTVASSVLICHGKSNSQRLDMEALLGSITNPYLGGMS